MLRSRFRAATIGALTLGTALVTGLLPAAAQAPSTTLTGFAVLPADTIADGPASGTQITATNGRTPPFAGQPVQGISAVLNNRDGTFLVMSDNGFGAKANSADYNLRVYTVRPAWRTAGGGAGTVAVLGYFQLSDPNRYVLWPLQNEMSTTRVLTGADFDIESFRRAPDGSFWFGDEFGPFLLHTDAQGRLLEAPIPLPVPPLAEFGGFTGGAAQVRSPDHPAFVPLDAATRTNAANLASSRGFEGMALSPDGTRLFALLEGAIKGDPDPRRLVVSEFDIERRAYTGTAWFYRLEAAGNAIGEMTAINDRQFLVIERDNNEGAQARFKKVYLVDSAMQTNGYAQKTEVVDLLRIADPNGLSGAESSAIALGNPFGFPFTTIESVLMLDAQTMMIVNDNNYPFSNGRRPGHPDDNEFIQIRLAAPLNVTGFR